MVRVNCIVQRRQHNPSTSRRFPDRFDKPGTCRKTPTARRACCWCDDPDSGVTEWLGSDGQPVTPLTSEQAISAVSSKTDITVDVTEGVTTAAEAANTEAANSPLWRAYSAENPSLRVTLIPRSGDVVAIRNLAWRAWDFYGCSISWIMTTATTLAPGCSSYFP